MEYPTYSLLLRSPQKQKDVFEETYDESIFQDLPDSSLEPPKEFVVDENFEELTNDLISYLENEEIFVKPPPLVSPNVMFVQKNQGSGMKYLMSSLYHPITEDIVEPPLASMGRRSGAVELTEVNGSGMNPLVLQNSFILQPKVETKTRKSKSKAAAHPTKSANTLPIPRTKEPSLSPTLPKPGEGQAEERDEDLDDDKDDEEDGSVINLTETIRKSKSRRKSHGGKHFLKILNKKKKKKKAPSSSSYVPPRNDYVPPPPRVPIPQEKKQRPKFKRSRIMTRSITTKEKKEIKIDYTNNLKKARRRKNNNNNNNKIQNSRPKSSRKVRRNNQNNNCYNNNSNISQRQQLQQNNNVSPSQIQKKKRPNKRKKKKMRILKDRNFQKRKMRKDAMVGKAKLRKDQRGKIGKDFQVQLKPCRRINTGFADNGLFPYYICSMPYKYILRIVAPDSYEEQDYDFYLRTFRQHTPTTTSKKRFTYDSEQEEDSSSEEDGSSDEDDEDGENDHSDGIEVSLRKVSYEGGNVIQLYHLQFTMTSFLNQSVEFRLVVHDEQGSSVFQSAKFKIVARKVKFEDDRFWNQFMKSSSGGGIQFINNNNQNLKTNNNNNNNNNVTGRKRKRRNNDGFVADSIEESFSNSRRKRSKIK